MAKVQAILRHTYDFGTDSAVLSHRNAFLNTADASLVYQGQKIELNFTEKEGMGALLFAVFYVLVYRITSGAYYSIVSGKVYE